MTAPLIHRLILWFRALGPPSLPLRRYRVTPRSNPAAFRRDLLLGIRDKLRRPDHHPARLLGEVSL
jgi:hypothetical protein